MTVSVLVFVLFMAMQLGTWVYNIGLLVYDFNVWPSCLLKLCSILVFVSLGWELMHKPKESSRFFQSLFHIPVTGAELLMILNIIAGIVLCLWIFQVCFISLRHSLRKKLGIFLSCIALLVVSGIVIFLNFVKWPIPNKVAAEVIACIALIILIVILKILWFFDNEDDNEDDSEDDSKYDFYSPLFSILVLFVIVYLTLSVVG